MPLYLAEVEDKEKGERETLINFNPFRFIAS